MRYSSLPEFSHTEQNLILSSRKRKKRIIFHWEKTVLISFYVFFFLSLLPSISRFKLRPESYKHKKVDCDLYYALINHNSFSVFVFACDAINYGREFCCFLSEGDAESDFNWFASVFYFISPVIYHIIFVWKDMKVDCRVNDQRKTKHSPHLNFLCNWNVAQDLVCSKAQFKHLQKVLAFLLTIFQTNRLFYLKNVDRKKQKFCTFIQPILDHIF